MKERKLSLAPIAAMFMQFDEGESVGRLSQENSAYSAPLSRFEKHGSVVKEIA